ncbi:MAG: GH25 family lysozyme [Candidatus Obscuribacterales bacterium]
MLKGIAIADAREVDWQLLSASEIKFVFILATKGNRVINPNFASLREEAQQAAISCGAYHVLDPSRSIEEQSDLFLSVVGDPTPGMLPHALFIEGEKWNWFGLPKRMPKVLAWLEVVEKKSKVRPILHLGYQFARKMLRTNKQLQLAKYPLWILNYNDVDEPKLPDPWHNWIFWDREHCGMMPGVSSAADLNVFSGELDDLAELGFQPAP